MKFLITVKHRVRKKKKRNGKPESRKKKKNLKTNPSKREGGG